MSDDRRSIELEIEVPGRPEEVWRAVATGPGISSWYVPHTIEERDGGAATASFGPGPEMQVAGRVAVWEPPRRICFDGGEGVEGLAFDWLIEARDDTSCVVRLVNTGFGEGHEWDAQYDAMTEGWRMFMFNLRLHLEHFSGQTATSALPMAMWAGPIDETWRALTEALGIPAAPSIGERIDIQSPDAPALAGTVVDTAPSRVALLLEQPAPGTAFVTAEDYGEHVGVSIWSYLYGNTGLEATERDGPLWQHWLNGRGPDPDTTS